MATPVVELSVTDPVNDQNFFRNGNFYSSFWVTPAGMSHAAGVTSSNANYWSIEPQGAAVVTKRSVLVPDTNSLFSNEIDGAVNVTTVWFGQNISGDLSATLRRNCTFSGYIYNFTGLTLSPKLGIDTANAFNNFTATTQRALVDLQTCAPNVWTYVSVTIDMSTYTNITNGIIVYIFLPSGTLSAAGKSVNFSRLKFQLGEIATEFTDDVGLFINTPSIDSTMLQDGCIARPSLFLPNVVPKGAYQAKSIYNSDIADGQINGRTMVSGAATTLTAAFTQSVNVVTTLSSGFTQPAVAASVSALLASTTGFVAGQTVTIESQGSYTVSSVTDATHLVLTNIGGAANVAPGTNVPISSKIGVTVSIAVTSTAGFLVDLPITIAVGGNYVVFAVVDATHMYVRYNGGGAAPGATVPTAGAVTLTSAVVGSLGYTPINKAGDSGIGPGTLQFTNDDVINTTSFIQGAITVTSTAANASNTGYMPAIGFHRPGVAGRAIGLGTNNRLLAPLTGSATQYYLLDSYFGVGNADIQAGAITIDKIAQSVINLIIPPGIMSFFAGPSPPSGWFVCDGSEVSRTTYAALFAAIGTYWGVGNNSSTFNLPDLQGRAPIGYVNRGAAGITGRGFASRGGSETHTLTSAEMPYHDHAWGQSAHAHSVSVTVAGHTHSVTNCIGGTVSVQLGGTPIYSPNGSTSTSNNGNAAAYGGSDAQYANINFNGQGGSQPHDQMQPYAVGYFIIKA